MNSNSDKNDTNLDGRPKRQRAQSYAEPSLRAKLRKGDQGSFGFESMYVKAGDQLRKIQKYAAISQDIYKKYVKPDERKSRKESDKSSQQGEEETNESED